MLLYKTSEAVFEDRIKNEINTRRIRLTGSVFIAIVAFIGMAKATPDKALEYDRRDQVRLDVADVKLVADRIRMVSDQFVDLDGCAAIKRASDCMKEIEGMRSAVFQMTAASKRAFAEDNEP